MKRIVDQVIDINKIVSQIAVRADEQASALQQVNVAVKQMDQMTQQNSAMVEETTAAAHSLNLQCDEQNRLVGQFRLDSAKAKYRGVTKTFAGI